MAESMKGLHRSHRCTEVSSANIGEKVTVMGWVQKRRNLGSLIFIDLRDRSGLLQIVFDEESVGAEGFAKAGTLRSEYVVAVEVQWPYGFLPCFHILLHGWYMACHIFLQWQIRPQKVTKSNT